MYKLNSGGFTAATCLLQSAIRRHVGFSRRLPWLVRLREATTLRVFKIRSVDCGLSAPVGQEKLHMDEFTFLG